MSAFNYNQYGATNISSVPKLVFAHHDEIQAALSNKQRANAPPEALKNEIDVKTVDKESIHNVRVRALMNQMEDKVFAGKTKLYSVFKKFDKDHDGYVSYDDFESALQTMNVPASKDEVKALLTHIDKNQKGYLDYSEFSKVFAPDMSTRLVRVPENDRHWPNSQPSKETSDANRLEQEKMAQTLKDAI